MRASAALAVAGILGASLSAHAEVLGVKLGARRPNGALTPALAAGEMIHVEVRCTRDAPLVVELTVFSDVNADGVVQEGERARLPPVQVRDGGAGDLDRAGGKVVAAVGRVPAAATALVVRVAARASVQRAALRLPPREEPWWRRLAKLRDITPNLRAPDGTASALCVFDVKTTAMRRFTVAGTAVHPALAHDGRRLAYEVRGDASSSVNVVDLERPAELSSIDDAASPEWLPADRAIAFVRAGRLSLFHPESRTFTALDVPVDRIAAARPALIVVQHVHGVDELHQVDIGDPTARIVPLHPGAAPEPRLSPDGARFLAVPKPGRLAIVERATGKTTPIPGRGLDARWSPSGASVVFVCPD